MRDLDYDATTDFIVQVFGETTEHNVEIRALPNERGAGPPQSKFTRDSEDIKRHCVAWDELGRAVYFGVATRLNGAHTGTRADLAELPALWVDIDSDKLGLDKAAAIAALRNMAIPPSIIVDSGGGIHAYWLLREALDVRAAADDAAATEEAIVAALKQLASIVAGDIAVCDLARILRLPGTHNTKTGALRLARVLESPGTRYEFGDLVEMLDWHRPVIERPVTTDAATPPPVANPYLDAAKRFGLKTPIDVERRLAAMIYLGDGDSGIHQTQLHVSASLIAQGVDPDAIAELLLEATKAACGIAGANWNWKREDRNIRALIETARGKFVTVKPPENAPPAAIENTTEKQQTVNSGARIIDFSEKRKARKSKAATTKDEDTPLISRIGKAAIEAWRAMRGPMVVINGDPHTYAEGIWHAWDKGRHHALRVTIQGIIAAANIDPKTQLLNAVYRYVIECPELMREGVTWDTSGLVVCQDGAIDPLTRAIFPHSPEHWATVRTEVRIADMGQGCPQWLEFLNSSFSDLMPAERAAVISTIGEWFGAAMVKGKTRELRKALWLYGESRTGKTRISEVLRLLLGEPTCALKLRALEKNFGGSALIGARAWIADDAVGSNDEVDDALFKVIVTGEAFSTDVKNSAHETVRLEIPVLFTSNPLPRIKDQSDAVFNRSLLVQMRVVRSEEATAGRLPIDEIVKEKELAGVFSWSLRGWARAHARGRFDPPRSMNDASADFKASNNVVSVWAKESVVVDKEMMIDRRDAYASFRGWYKAEFGEDAKIPSAKFMMMALRQCMVLGVDHKRVGVRYVTGVKLSDDGLIYRDESGGYGETIGSGCGRGDVNKPRPFQTDEAPESGKKPPEDRSPRF